MNWSEDLIWKYVDGDCTPQEQSFIEEQLATNADAKLHYQEIMSIHTSLQDNVVITSPVDFTDRVMANLKPKHNLAYNYIMRGSSKAFLPVAILVATLAVMFGLYRSNTIDTSALGDISILLNGQTIQLLGILVICGLFFFTLDRLLTYLDMRRVNAG